MHSYTWYEGTRCNVKSLSHIFSMCRYSTWNKAWPRTFNVILKYLLNRKFVILNQFVLGLVWIKVESRHILMNHYYVIMTHEKWKISNATKCKAWYKYYATLIFITRCSKLGCEIKLNFHKNILSIYFWISLANVLNQAALFSFKDFKTL